MRLMDRDVFYGRFVTFGCDFVMFGVAGGSVFLTLMTEDFGWSCTTISLAFPAC